MLRRLHKNIWFYHLVCTHLNKKRKMTFIYDYFLISNLCSLYVKEKIWTFFLSFQKYQISLHQGFFLRSLLVVHRENIILIKELKDYYYWNYQCDGALLSLGLIHVSPSEFKTISWITSRWSRLVSNGGV